MISTGHVLAHHQVQIRLSSRRPGTVHHSGSDVMDLLKITEAERTRSPVRATRLMSFESEDSDEGYPSNGMAAVPSPSHSQENRKRASLSVARVRSDDDEASLGPSVVSTTTKASNSANKSSSTPAGTEPAPTLRSTSTLSAAAPDGALPAVSGQTASIPSPSTSRPGSRKGRSATLMGPRSRPSTPNRPIIGGGSHQQYERRLVATPKDSNDDQPVINFAEELKAWLTSVTNFSGDIYCATAEQATSRPVLKKTLTMGSFSSTGTRSGRQTMMSISRGPSGMIGDNVSKNSIDSPGKKIMCDEQGSQTPDTKPLRSYGCNEDDDDLSVLSQVSGSSLGIKNLEIRATLPEARRRVSDCPLSDRDGLSPVMNTSPSGAPLSTLEVIMSTAGSPCSPGRQSSLSHCGDVPLVDAINPSNVWNPKRTQVKLRKIMQRTPKMKIASAVAAERRKYSKGTHHLPEIKRGKNPLVPVRYTQTKESQVSTIRDALASHVDMLSTTSKSLVGDGTVQPDFLRIVEYDTAGQRDKRQRNGSARCTDLEGKSHKLSVENVSGVQDSSQLSLSETGPFFLTGEPNTSTVTNASPTDTYIVPPSLFMAEKRTSGTGTDVTKASQLCDYLRVTSDTIPQYYLSSKFRRGFANTNMGSVDSSPIQMTSSTQSRSVGSGLLSLAPAGPWIPPGGLDVMVSDKTDMIFGHEENRDVGLLYETTKHKTVIGRQHLIRSAFEMYCKETTKVTSDKSNARRARTPQGPVKGAPK